jgi:hypothetical protein
MNHQGYPAPAKPLMKLRGVRFSGQIQEQRDRPQAGVLFIVAEHEFDHTSDLLECLSG